MGKCADCSVEQNCRKHRPCPIGCECGRHGGERRYPDRPVVYSSRHQRVRKLRGKASGYPCAECDAPAREWAQTHGTDGMDPYAHYRPMCRRCHRSYDGIIEKMAAAVPDSNRRRRGESRPPVSEETREKISIARRGKLLSPEHRNAIGEGVRGIKRSAETRERMRVAAVAAWERRRQLSA